VTIPTNQPRAGRPSTVASGEFEPAADQPTWTYRLPPDEVAVWSARTDPAGPLVGVPFAIKDNLDLIGTPTTAAYPGLAGEVAAASAVAVRRLVDAGAVPIGKTNMDQFATGLVGTRTPYGACHSVASAAHICGGSSSGSAIAVATGLADLALATDTAGSGRVPAALNGIVGHKPTLGLISSRGLMPACRGLDCVSTMAGTVAGVRSAFQVLAHVDPDDPWSRARPPTPPAGVATRMRVVGVPGKPLDLEPTHALAWAQALRRLRLLAAHVVIVDVEPMLAAGQLLYGGAFLAARWEAFGHYLGDDDNLDPVVRQIVQSGAKVTGADVFRDRHYLASLCRAAAPLWSGIDALMLPVTPGHPRLSDVAADPVGVNTWLGTYTTFANLLDLCAVSVPAVPRADGLPFGVQFLAPAFADDPLLDLAARWCGETLPTPPPPTGTTLLAVVGAHLSGLELNSHLVATGARLEFRARTAAGYRLYRLGNGVARPALLRSGDGPPGGIEVEVWRLPHQGVGALQDSIPSPLTLGRVELDDGSTVIGFLAEEHGVRAAPDISNHGGWRAALAADRAEAHG
jgi:allophanate hydrolase